MEKKILLGTLLAAYLAAVAAAYANPRHLPRHQQALSIQAATLATLGLLAPLLRTPLTSPATALLAVLGLSFAARLVHLGAVATAPQDQLTSVVVRWDSFAMTAGLLATAAIMAYELGGLPFALALLLVGLPLLLNAPRVSSATTVHTDLLDASLEVAGKAYDVASADDSIKDADFVYDPKTGTLAGVTTYKDSTDTYVFFSGTTSLADWVRVNTDIADADFAVDDCFAAVKVHRGFLNAYTAVRAKLWVKLQEFVLRKGGAGRVVCVGHSLGGALATLASLDFACRMDPEDAKALACVTFGAPQVGDGLFVKEFDARVPLSLRVAAVYDPVPRAMSTQLPHVKGYVPIASPPIFPYTHDLTAYKLGLRQSPTTTLAVMAAPLLFVVLSAVVFAKLAPRLQA